MNQSRHEQRRQHVSSKRKSRPTLSRVVIGSTIAVVAGVGVIQLWNVVGGGDAAASSPSLVEQSVFSAAGLPLDDHPLAVAGIEVAQPAVNLGVQPLDTPVNHEFRLRNTGSTPVTLGRASIQVLQGCCPTDPILSTTRIEPGAEAPLFFTLPMGMHAGMDGPHLFRVTVPVQNENGETGKVEVYVKADFRPGATSTNRHS